MSGAGDRERGSAGHRDIEDPTARFPDEPVHESLVEIAVPAGQEPGVRLDQYLTSKLPNATRAKVQRGIREGRVSVNGAPQAKPSYPVQPGDRIVCRVLRPPPVEVVPEPIPLDVVYEDAWLLVVNKPAGMVVHPAYGHRSGTLVNALLHHVGAGPLSAADLARGVDEDDEDDPSAGSGPAPSTGSGQAPSAGSGQAVGLSTVSAGPRFEGDPTARPGLVHRLDKDTSGLLVVAKDDAAHAALAAQFAGRRIRRLYLALVWGVPSPPAGRVETGLGRDPRDRKRMAVRPEGQGKWAATNYETVEAFAHTALVRFRLETGRTHQIRVHALHLGHPLLGDATYGGDRIRSGPDTTRRRQFFANLFEAMPRHALHAHTLGFRHPATGRDLDFEAPLPADMAYVLEQLRHAEPR
jgi:23S rRNA pseudouridine1911/1915/1917 synthase